MIDRDHDLPLSSQADCLNISRGIIYYEPATTSPGDLVLMRRIVDDAIEIAEKIDIRSTDAIHQ